MTEAVFIKVSGGFKPADAQAAEMLSGIRNGELVKVKVSRPRNLGHHRRFFALLTLVAENQETFATVDDLLDALKVWLGHYETRVLPTGETVFKPKSISFAKMDQGEFRKFWNRTCDLIAQHVIPGIRQTDLEREVAALIGIS